LIIAGYIAMIVFTCACYVLYKFPITSATFVYSRAILCLLGICVIGLSIAASFGFMVWVGIKLSPINAMLVPFLGLGMGTYDVLVFLGAFSHHHKYQDDVEERLVNTFVSAASAITVTSMSNLAAFLIPAFLVKLPVVYIFSFHMSAAILLNWILLMTLFGPMMLIDAMRTRRKMGTCCFNKTEISESDARGDKPNRYSFEAFATNVLGPLYASKLFKLIVILCFLALTGTLTWVGFAKTKSGLLLSDVALKNTYLREYLALQEQQYPIFSGSMITRDFNGDIKNFQKNVLAELIDIKGSPYMDRTFSTQSQHWLYKFVQFYNTTYPLVDGTVPSVVFYPYLRGFLSSPSGINYLATMICRDVETQSLTTCENIDGTTIVFVTSNSNSYYNYIFSDEDRVKAIKSIRAFGDASGGNHESCCSAQGNGTAFSPKQMFYGGILFQYWEQYVDIQRVGEDTVGWSILGVFLVTLVFQASPLTSILAGCMTFVTVLQLYGFMYILDIKLNGFSVTNLAVCVGVCIDFTAYISYAFLRAEGDVEVHGNDQWKARDARVAIAMTEMFPPLFIGAVTTEISVACLAFAKFPFFSQYYFQMISMMLVFSMFNGLVVLPVLLSLIGPHGLNSKERNKSVMKPIDMAGLTHTNPLDAKLDDDQI